MDSRGPAYGALSNEAFALGARFRHLASDPQWVGQFTKEWVTGRSLITACFVRVSEASF